MNANPFNCRRFFYSIAIYVYGLASIYYLYYFSRYILYLYAYLSYTSYIVPFIIFNCIFTYVFYILKHAPTLYIIDSISTKSACLSSIKMCSKTHFCNASFISLSFFCGFCSNSPQSMLFTHAIN